MEPSPGKLRDPDHLETHDYESLYGRVAREPEEYPYRDYDPVHPSSGWRDIIRKITAPIVALGAFLIKFGAVIFKLKFLTVAGSMIVSIGAYAWLGGWWFGVGLVGLIFVHEMGHFLEAKRQGLPVSAPVFIPFLGAAILMRKMPPNAWREALIGIAGPIVGSAGAAVVWAFGEHYDSRFLQALAFVGFFINLFNLLPVLPLDGGRVVSALHPALWAVGLLGLLGLAVRWHNPILYIIIFLGGLELWRRWKIRHLPEAKAYYKVAPWQRVVIAGLYVGLAILLVVGMNATHVPRDF